MLNLRRLLALLILVSVGVLLVVVWREVKQQSPEELLAALPKQIDLSLDQLHYTQNENGQRSWTLDADKAEYQRDNSQALLDNVRLQFYHAGDSGNIHLQAQQGLLLQDSRQVEVWDQVIVTTDRGEQLLTERLNYDGVKRQLKTADPIRLTSAQMELTGTGLQIDLDTGRLEVKNDVWVLLLPAERKSPRD